MSAENTVEIRRYPNRRLYDRSRRQYVTLQDVETMVMEGTNVEVRDSRTGEDLTRQLLTQILMERHPRKMDLFPVGMLHNILRANEMAGELWRGYLRQTLAAMEHLQKAANPFATPMSWVSAFFPGFGPSQPASSPVQGPSESADPIAQRLDDLASRIDRLEADAGGPAHGPADGESVDQLERRVRQLEATTNVSCPPARRGAKGSTA